MKHLRNQNAGFLRSGISGFIRRNSFPKVPFTKTGNAIAFAQKFHYYLGLDQLICGLHEEGTLRMAHTGNITKRTACLPLGTPCSNRHRSGNQRVFQRLVVLLLALGMGMLSGCANTNGYNGQPCYPYNAYPYAPQPQYGVPGTYQPGGVYPAPGAAAPMMPNTGAPIGSPGVMQGGTYPAGMVPNPGYNNMPGYSGQPVGGPGQPFIGS